MGWQSKGPAVVEALVTAFKASSDLDGVTIYDGANVTASPALEVVAVGFSPERMSRTGTYPEPPGPEIESTFDFAGLSVLPQKETLSLVSTIAVRNGSGDQVAARARAYAILNACGAVVAADKTLGGVVMLARIASHNLTLDQETRGADATISFTVQAIAQPA